MCFCLRNDVQPCGNPLKGRSSLDLSVTLSFDLQSNSKHTTIKMADNQVHTADDFDGVLQHNDNIQLTERDTESVMVLPVSKVNGKLMLAIRIRHEEGREEEGSLFGGKFKNVGVDLDTARQCGVNAFKKDSDCEQTPEYANLLIKGAISDSALFTIINPAKKEGEPAKQVFLGFQVPRGIMSVVVPLQGEQIGFVDLDRICKEWAAVAGEPLPVMNKDGVIIGSYVIRNHLKHLFGNRTWGARFLQAVHLMMKLRLDGEQ